jgi:pimeloyl-ACP methyl ester carboxylesterase
MNTIRLLILIHSFLLFCAAPALCAEVIDIPVPKGKPQRILLYPAPAAEATVILFPGGDGVVGIRDNGTADRPGHTFTRSMNLWENQRINAVLFDTPDGLGTNGELRDDTDHINRISSVISYLRRKSSLPVWLVGHSNGTLSVASYMNASPENEKNVSGLVILGTEHKVAFKRPVKLPILAVHHNQDGCNVTPMYASVKVIAAAKATSPLSELIRMDGGRQESAPCKARSYHGFLGIEDELIARVGAFVRKGSATPTAAPK